MKTPGKGNDVWLIHSPQLGQPGLIFVMRAKIGQYGVGQVTFKQLRGPVFPVMKEELKQSRALNADVTAQYFGG